MAKRWSKLQCRIEALFDPELNMRIHCAGFRDDHDTMGFHTSGRYWVTVSGKVIWDFPKDFVTWANYWDDANRSNYHPASWSALAEINGLPVDLKFPYTASDISALIRDYIDTPVGELLSKSFANDGHRLTDLFKAADRRISRKRVAHHFDGVATEAVTVILAARDCLPSQR